MKNLVELDFSYNRLGVEGAILAAQSPNLKHLRVLDLRGWVSDAEQAAGAIRRAFLICDAFCKGGE